MSALPGARPALLTRVLAGAHGVDWRNAGLILAGWAVILALIPWPHEYPIIDDWVYAGAAQHQLLTGRFDTPPQSETNLLGLIGWAALWTHLFGFSFTVLTASTLLLATVGLLAFYALARRCGVPPAGALLGTALLAINPLWLHLSYSFMSDVPFLAVLLVACLCYLVGLQGSAGVRPLAWLVLGGLFASWAFLIRQLGLLVPAAAFGYLLLAGLPARRWRWGALVAIVLGALPIVVWYLLNRGTPPNEATLTAAERAAAFVGKESWLHVIGLRLWTALPLIGLFVPAAAILAGGRRRWLLIGATALVCLLGLYAVDRPIGQWNPLSEPPFTASVGPASFTLPQEPYPFARIGNILRVDGIDFFQYDQESIWSPETWRALWALGVGLGVLLLAGLAGRALAAGAELRRRPALDPAWALYLLGALLLGVTVALAGDFYDRYLLAFLPFALLFVVRGVARWGRGAWATALAGLLLLAAWSLALKADQVDHDNARWTAGQWLLAHAGPPQVGYDWNNWVPGGNPAYYVRDFPVPGYRTEQHFPYLSRLSGFTTRAVLAEVRADQPPLPGITPAP